jgi:hypothetical protein
VLRLAARRYGFIDPLSWLARLRAFAQPSEVQEPIELLRAGIVFHARGLVNVKAIQHNLDWVWPFWVERQFKPGDPSFIPRAFSFSHINLTHRNWTAVGLPEIPIYPVVDPRGLVTPLHDGWSLDFWVITDEGQRLLPSKLDDAQAIQQLHLNPNLMVETICRKSALKLALKTSMVLNKGVPTVLIEADAESAIGDGWLVAAVRPYNPEGVQFIDEIHWDTSTGGLVVNQKTTVHFDGSPDGLRMAHYAEGDTYFDLGGTGEKTKISCDAGMATAAVLFRLDGSHRRSLKVTIPLTEEIEQRGLKLPANLDTPWADRVAGAASLKVPDEKIQFLYDAAVRTLLLLSADELVPGPNTYRRFWFRDACLMLNPMLALGLVDRAKRILDRFPSRQNHSGYFSSQEGEWDSNGQVLWIAARYAAVTNTRLSEEMEQSLQKGMRWLAKKRLAENSKSGPAGLLPAGFSAEHLGPNDFYYWDDFWAVGGLRDMASYWRTHGQNQLAEEAEKLGREYSASIEKSISAIPAKRAKGAIPAAPTRRMDAGAVGSMVADYPLQLYPPGERRLMATTGSLMERCFYHGGFLQEMIHSGINAYLTLDLAQTLLRASDPKYADLIRAVADLASPTGQWPEAIHPNTLGGCMGDGQHGWAAGEWIMMIRNCFVRKEEATRTLVIGSGIFPEWITPAGELTFGPTYTTWGVVTVSIRGHEVHVQADWSGNAPRMRIAVPGFQPLDDASANIPHPLVPLSI